MPITPYRVSLLGLFVLLAGCASGPAADERLWALESEMELLRAQETRLLVVEDRLQGISRELEGLRNAVLDSGVVVFPAPRKDGTAPLSHSPAGSGLTTEPARHADLPVPASASGTAPASVPGSTAYPASSPAPRPEPHTTPAQVPVHKNASSAPVKTGVSEEQTLYNKALAALEAGRAQEAFGMFDAFMTAYPQSRLAPNALYWRGESSYSMGRYADAVIAFKDVVARYPGHPKAAAAMLKAGYAYERLGDRGNARLYLEALLEDYPKSDPARLARAKLATL